MKGKSLKGCIVTSSLKSFDWEEQGEAQDGTALLGCIQIGGVPHHVNAIRVEDQGEEQIQAPVKGDAEMYQNLLDIYEDRLQTVKIPGHPGDWVLVIHPYGD